MLALSVCLPCVAPFVVPRGRVPVSPFDSAPRSVRGSCCLCLLCCGIWPAMVPFGWPFLFGILLREPAGFHADRAHAWAAKNDGWCVNVKLGQFGPCTSSGDVGVTGDPPFGWERPGTAANCDSDGDLGLAGGPKNGQMSDKDTFDFPLAQTSPEALETTPGPPFDGEPPCSHSFGTIGTVVSQPVNI